jgi:predicted phosphodiesterase
MSATTSRYGIITDIHSNLAALRAVLDALQGENVSTILCLGDLVGYGPSPSEVIAAVRGLPLVSIRGNHDRYALGEDSDQIRSATAEAVDYTRRALSPDDLAFLRSLPDSQLVDNRILLVHGSPRDRDEYIIANDFAIANFKHFKAEYAGIYLCFFGHTHLPMIIGDGKVVRQFEPNYVLSLKRMSEYLINPGSVGQPRDGNPDAAYAVLDLAESTVTFRRVPYDIEDTHRRVLAAGLQRHLGDRLRVGK